MKQFVGYLIKKAVGKGKVSPTIKSVKPTKDIKGSVKRVYRDETSKRIDATTKVGPEKKHSWGEVLKRPKDLESKVSQRWDELGLSDLEGKEADPELFGYVMEELLRQKQLSKT